MIVRADPREIVEAVRMPYQEPAPDGGGHPSCATWVGCARLRLRRVHFLDDDVVPDGHYAAVKAEFERHPGIGLVFRRIKPPSEIALPIGT